MFLVGIKVVEIGQNLAGPYGAQILADLGAEVIKIERLSGDDARSWGTRVTDDTTTMFMTMNRNKESVSIDLKTARGLSQIQSLIGDADIFIHNMRPGSLIKLGLDATALRRKYPCLIYCDIGAFGHLGPLREEPGYEPLMQAYGGLVSINGHPDGPVARVAVSLIDIGTGMWTAIGALAALHHRHKTGKGCVINTSLYETALAWGNYHMAEYHMTGQVPQRQASGHSAVAPYQAFDGADGPFMILAGNDRLFEKLAIVLGKAKWVKDPRFRTNQDRVANRAELINAIQAIVVKGQRAEWVEKLRSAGVPSAPVQTIPEVLQSPQTRALNILQNVPGTDLKLVGMPISFDGERPSLRFEPPSLGASNQKVTKIK